MSKENVIDKLETMILIALDANHQDTRSVETFNGPLGLRDSGTFLKTDKMLPASAYTADMTDESRIYTSDKDYLTCHPADILGDEAEIMLINEGSLVWRGYRRLSRAPKGVVCLGKASHWYEMHIRSVMGNGQGEYFKRVVPLDRSGSPLPAKLNLDWVCTPIREGSALIVDASIIDDAHRANTMLAEVKDATEIKFPVPLGDYKALFAEREGPMNGSRRKAIVHWVAQHLRNSCRGNEFEVTKHTRGVREFHIDGLTIRLTPNQSAAR